MGLIHRLVRWYHLRWGKGKHMREAGATVRTCPHCGKDTPVYQASYGSSGDPINFTVCLWCEGLIQYTPDVSRPHEPFASPERIAKLRREEREKRRRYLSRSRAARSKSPRSAREEHLRSVGWGHGWI